MAALKALSTADVCEWLQGRGASQQDVESIRNGRFNGRVLNLLAIKGRVDTTNIRGMTDGGVALLKELVAVKLSTGPEESTYGGFQSNHKPYAEVLKALSTADVCEWLSNNGASPCDVNNTKIGRYNGRILSFLDQRSCVDRIELLSREGIALVKQLIEVAATTGCVKSERSKVNSTVSRLVTVQILSEDQELEIDVEPDTSLEELLDCIQLLGVEGVEGVGQLERWEEGGEWSTVRSTEQLRLGNGAKYRPRMESSNSLTVLVLHGSKDCPVCVEADLELEDFLSKVSTELGLSGETQLEQYEEDMDKWMTVTDTEDLELRAGAKYRVKSRDTPRAGNVEPSTAVTVCVLSGDQELEFQVEPDLELEDLLVSVRARFGLLEGIKLLQHDMDFDGRWVTLTHTEDLDLNNGSRFKVQSL